ncbi:hypothetical protein MTO96_004244 [Rhipicephalus appendiculatus]
MKRKGAGRRFDKKAHSLRRMRSDNKVLKTKKNTGNTRDIGLSGIHCVTDTDSFAEKGATEICFDTVLSERCLNAGEE